MEVTEEGIYSRLFEFIGRHWRGAVAALTVVCVLSILGIISLVRYDGDAMLMLPKTQGITRSVNYFRGQDAMGKVVISLELMGDEHDIDDLISAADALAESLAESVGGDDQQEAKMFTSIATGPDLSEAAQGIDVLFGALPYLLSEQELQDNVAPRLSKVKVAERLKAGYLGMFRPGGVMSGSMIMQDPLGLRIIALNKLSELSKSTGFEITIEQGHFISTDGIHALILADTSIESTDTIGSKRLVAFINKSMSGLPSYIEGDVISGHMHTVSNEQTIKSDIRLTLAIATVGFVILFVFFIGDFGSILIFMVPAIAVAVAVNLSYLILGQLSYMVMGLAAVVAGISVDYAIHIYIGTRKGMANAVSNTVAGLDAAKVVKGMVRPIAYGALTTVGMFGSFFFSGIEGYHQMAVFSIISVLVSLGISLFVLSHIVQRWGSGSAKRLQGYARLENVPEQAGRWAFAAWLVMTVIFGWLAMGVELDPDIRAIDGTDKTILAGEDRFFETWGKSRLAVLVGQAEDMQHALALGEELAGEVSLTGKVDPSRISSLSMLWPSIESMRDNHVAWQSFWSKKRISTLRENLLLGGKPYGYSPNAFEPFMRLIAEHSMPEQLPELGITERYIRQLADGSYQVSVFFPDEAEAVSAVMERINKRDDAYVVSGEALGMMISDSVTADMKKMTAAAALAIIVLTAFFLRSPALTAAALIPVLTSTLWLAGGVNLLGLKLNVATLVAFIVVMGLCVDYGIFMAHRSTKDRQQRGQGATVLAVTLSALSSLIGAGVLVFASHPALFSVGITLVIGLGSGYLSSVLVVPWVADRLGAKG